MDKIKKVQAEEWISAVQNLREQDPAEVSLKLWDWYQSEWIEPPTTYIVIWGIALAMYKLSCITEKNYDLAVQTFDLLIAQEEFHDEDSDVTTSLRMFRAVCIGGQLGREAGLREIERLSGKEFPPRMQAQRELLISNLEKMPV